jgi:hypothetical protein
MTLSSKLAPPRPTLTARDLAWYDSVSTVKSCNCSANSHPKTKRVPGLFREKAYSFDLSTLSGNVVWSVGPRLPFLDRLKSASFFLARESLPPANFIRFLIETSTHYL